MINFIETQQTFIFFGVFLWLLILSVLFYKIFSHYKRLIGKTRRGDLVDILNQQMGTMKETNIVLKNFKEKGSDCTGNFQCASDLCDDGFCKNKGLFTRLFNWLSSIF